MFSELDGFIDENNMHQIEENSNEENDVDEETMSGENDIEDAYGLNVAQGYDDSDILSRLLCAAHGRGVTPAASDGSAPGLRPAPVGPAPLGPAPRADPQLSTAAHTDMLLLNLMKINGLTPKCSRTNYCTRLVDPKRNWMSMCMEELDGLERCCSGSGSEGGSVSGNGGSGMGGSGGCSVGGSGSDTRTRSRARAGPLSPGQLRTEPVGQAGGASPPSSPCPRAAPEPCSCGDLSDTEDVEAILDYNDTLFDMLLNSLSLDVSGQEPPPAHPWSPAQPRE
ncbi:uncharacterized protein LOC126966362 [Leptidea sinapis]|uniref:uncharacterized protein LOC126966362 n=1 Tax=Leptidea sinapis TaxID=189913 RepID=UPI00212C15DE|nr:uncharacterized protein LOC126966362 [Leptidea sinapis]